MIDTITLARRLEAAGFPAKQAGDVAKALADALADSIATKTDLIAAIAPLATKTEIAEAKADILKWMFGAIGFQTLVILSAVVALAAVAHH
jgi:hypothetical protein